MHFAGVPHDEYPAIADHIRPFLAGFAGDGANSVESLEAHILARDLQCWIAGEDGIKVVCLTEIGTDLLKTCHVSFCGGDEPTAWVALVEKIADWARAEGCARVRVTARPGYERLLSRHSFRKTHVVLDRSL